MRTGILAKKIGMTSYFNDDGTRSPATLLYIDKCEVTNIQNNELIVCQGHDNPALYQKKITASQTHWISGMLPTKKKLNAKIRYRSNDIPCTITEINNNKIFVIFENPCFACRLAFFSASFFSLLACFSISLADLVEA